MPSTQRNLAQCEAVIQRGLNTFSEVAEAIRAIHKHKVYKPEYPNFTKYCQKRWGWSKAYVYRLLQGAIVVQNLSVPPAIVQEWQEIYDPESLQTEAQKSVANWRRKIVQR